jgi:glutamyl-tRNA synthetase
MTSVKTRFAPSPTGDIHLGNLRTALFNALYAAHARGRFVLRIEDTDAERSRPEYTAGLMRDLRWLGLHWDEGPETGVADGPYQQSQRTAIYADYYDRLAAAGRTYPCFCTDTQLKLDRKARLAAGKPPRYAGTCAQLTAEQVERKRAQGLSPTLRFRVGDSGRIEFDDLVRGRQRFERADIGDFIVRRSDGSPAFFFGNAIDDALMGVTHVLRGEDHLTNTPRQLLLLEALDLPPPAYGHLSLLVGSDGSPLSKRHGSRSVRELREAGYLPTALMNYLARLGHTFDSDALLDFGELAQSFALERLGRAPARYDQAQLDYWQKLAVQQAGLSELREWLERNAGDGLEQWVPAGVRDTFIEAVRDNVQFPADAVDWGQRLFASPPALSAQAGEWIRAAGVDFFEAALDEQSRGHGEFKTFAQSVGARAGVKGKPLFMPLRCALTGLEHGPEMHRIWKLLEGQRQRARLEAALRLCETEKNRHA